MLYRIIFNFVNCIFYVVSKPDFMAFIYIGTIVKSRSFKGEMFVNDVPRDVRKLAPGCTLLVGFSEQFSKRYTLSRWKKANDGALLLLREIDNDESALSLREQGIYIDEADIRKSNSGIRMTSDIIGCKVSDFETGAPIGEVIDVWHMPANDVWVVDTPQGQLPVPVVDEFIKFVDIGSKIIKIFLMPGLMDLTDTSGSEEDE